MEWLQFGEKLQTYENAVQWAIGDWLNYGERTYGEEYAQAVEITGYKVKTLWQYAYVAKHVEYSTRVEVLSHKHHEVVAGLTPDEQRFWLERAAEGDGEKRWSVATLRAAIKDAAGKDFPSWLKRTDVWNFTACDERFGLDYPGRIPGQIVLNVLHYYTKEGDFIVDPMAGGGVTMDACKEMNRRCIAFDKIPFREDIIQHDSTTEWPITEEADLVFIDPPYYSQMKDDYHGMAELSYDDYLADMQKIFTQAHIHLKTGGYLAVLIAPMAVQTEAFLDTTFDFVQMCKASGYSYVRRISVPVSTQQIGPQVMEHRRDHNIMVAIIRDLIIFQKEP